jgi:hypothetical protein
MNSLVEAVSPIVLFILTPVIVVWVQINLVKVVENIRELPIEGSETGAVYRWADNSEETVLGADGFLNRAVERGHSELA